VATAAETREPARQQTKGDEMFKLKSRGSTSEVETRPPAAWMRGRSEEISDAAAFDWQVIWEALKTEPPADGASTITQELGLDQEKDIRTGNEHLPGTEFSGTRRGRHVALRVGIVPEIRGKGMNEVQVAAAVAPFRIVAKDGRLAAESGAMPEVDDVLARLSPAPKVWRDVVIVGGPDGIRSRRPVTAHAQGYLYDLWLVEQLADALGA
jgi:hypothetical protein